MSGWISGTPQRLMPRYVAVHLSGHCRELARVAVQLPVPDEFERYFTPCDRCCDGNRWYPLTRRPKALFDWYRQARSEASR